MIPPPSPPDEHQRLEALRGYEVLDTPPETAFDRLTALAARLLDVPIVLVSLVDAERQWFKAACGLDLRELPREISFCGHAILHEGMFIVPDATRDARFADNPLVTGHPGIRFYAGAPLVTPDGRHRLGTLCAISPQPRELDDASRQTLTDLAAIVVDGLELRRETLRRERAEEDLAREHRHRYRHLVEQASDAFYVYDLDGRFTDVNQAACDATGFSRAELLTMGACDLLVGFDPAEARLRWDGLAPGRPVTVTGLCRRKDGGAFLAEARISVFQTAGESGDGTGRRLFALARDITARQREADLLRDANDRLEARVSERTATLGRVVEELRESVEENQRLAVAIDSLDMGVVIADAQTPGYPVIFANPAFSAVTGYPLGEVIGQGCRFLQGQDTDGNVLGEMRDALRDGQPFRGTLLNYRRDGTPFWNDLTISPVGGEPGRPRYFIAAQVDVTARRQSEERLRLLESVVVNAHDAILITEAEPVETPGPRIIYVNRTFERMTGYPEAEVLGKTPRLLQGPDTAEEAKANIQRALKRWRPVRQEMVNYRRDGTPFWVELNITPVANERGWFTHWVSVQRDITERKQAEEALRYSEELYRRLFDTNPLPTWAYDLETLTFLEVNPAAIAHYGYTREEFLGMTVRDMHPPGDMPLVLQFLQELGSPDSPPPRTWRHRRRDGSEILVEVAGDDLTFAGRPARLVVVHDVTEKRRTEEALRESQVRFERMTANVPGMVYQFVLKADGSRHFTFVSEGCREIYGVEPEVFLNRHETLRGMVTPEVLTDTAVSMGESAATLQPWRHEWIIRLPPDDRPKHLQGFSRPERRENGDTVWDGVILDVTERKRSEGLERAKETAERANLAKSEFLSRMSHELRTPLNAILGFGQLLELEELPRGQGESVEHIMRAGRHLLGLIDEVLDIARIESGNFPPCLEPVPVGTMLRETLGLIRPLTAERAIRLRGDALDGIDPAWAVLADLGRLKQILLNLLSNAVKYNRRGGEVEVRCVEVTPPGQAPGAGNLRLTVRDTGEGIAPELLFKLFTPFERLSTTHGAVEGTGLGLAVSKRLAEAMGGAIGVESTPGVGSTFWVELPRAAGFIPTAPGPAVSPPASPAPVPGGRRLLHIEDNPSNLRLVESIVAQQRPTWLLSTATDGPDGLQMARALVPDLILLDLQLPGMSGDAVLAELRADELTRDVPVILLSADANPVSRERLLAAGARAYLTKPFDMKNFLDVVEAGLAGTPVGEPPASP